MLQHSYGIPAGINNLYVGTEALSKAIRKRYPRLRVQVNSFTARQHAVRRSYSDVFIAGTNKHGRPLRIAVKVETGVKENPTPWKDIKAEILNQVEAEYEE